jgi:hypothetical protein
VARNAPIAKPRRPQLAKCHRCKELTWLACEEYNHRDNGFTYRLTRLVKFDQAPTTTGNLLTFKRKAGFLYVDEDQSESAGTDRRRYTQHECEATK